MTTDPKGNRVIYLHVRKAIYGMLVSSLLFYKKLRTDLGAYGFEVNPYDPCVANKMVDGKQLTIRWHVDDLMASHVSAKALQAFCDWLDDKYGDDELGHCKIDKGPKVDFLAIIFDHSVPGQVTIQQFEYLQSMVEEFEAKYPLHKEPVPTPYSNNLFNINESPKLDQTHRADYHTFVAKGLFACKRARPDIQLPISFLSTRVKEPTEHDWIKLHRMMKFLRDTIDDPLTLTADKLNLIQFSIDASFAVHPDMKSHSGMTMTMGKGTVIASSRKQKINTCSSTEAELVAVDDNAAILLWTRLFVKAQGYEPNITVLQDNQSTIKLHENGRWSSHKHTRHLNIKYFFMKDQIEQGHFKVQYHPTDKMNSDLLTKPVQGEQAQVLRADIMNLPAPSVTAKLTKPLPIALPLQGMPAWMFTQTPRKVAFCNMNVALPAEEDDDDEADEEEEDDDDEDKEPSSPVRECSPSPDEPPVVVPAPVLLDRHPTIWITGNVIQQGPIPEPMLHPTRPNHRIHPDDTNLHHDFHMDLKPDQVEPLPPPTTTVINWTAF